MNGQNLTKKEFDRIIKNNLILSGIPEACFGYATSKNTYSEYYSEDEFDKFVEDMRSQYPQHFIKFSGDKSSSENAGGKGGELVPKTGRYGLMPPKMASVGSSSRFCYLALRNGSNSLADNKTFIADDVEFEKECKIFDDITAAPQLDAYVSGGECDIFIEAKCHEIFDSHKIVFKEKYRKCLTDIASFKELIPRLTEGEREFELPLKGFGINGKSSRFDIKQLICHLLGIANHKKGCRKRLTYLFFYPIASEKADRKKTESLFLELRDEIRAIFTSEPIASFCRENQIELSAIAEHSRVMEDLTKENTVRLYPEE